MMDVQTRADLHVQEYMGQIMVGEGRDVMSGVCGAGQGSSRQ